MNITFLNPGKARKGTKRRTKMAHKAKKKLYRTSKGHFTTRKTGRPVHRKRSSAKKRPAKKHHAKKRHYKKRKNPVAKRAPSKARRYNPKKKSAKRRKSRKHGIGQRAIFGLPQAWTKWPLVGPLFMEDVFFTGAGVSVGVGLIPMLEGKLIESTGLMKQEWYSKLDAKGQPPMGKRALDTLIPAAIGSAVGGAAFAVKNRMARSFGKGFALAGVGLGLGRLLDWLVWSRVEGTTKPAPTPGPGTKGYLTAAPGRRPGASGYLTAAPGQSRPGQSRGGMGSTYLGEGGSHGSFGAYNYGEETEIAQMFAEQRTF